MTLWPISDETTVHTVHDFYHWTRRESGEVKVGRSSFQLRGVSFPPVRTFTQPLECAR
jgi:hypothetical protein